MAEPSPQLAPLVKQWAVLLTTYKRDGTPVGTAVNMAVEGNHAYVRTPENTGKVKRIRNNPEVEVAPSSASGKPTGPAIHARARVLTASDPEFKRASDLINHKHPIVQRIGVGLIDLVSRHKSAFIEITPVGE
jgi:hypothetical protein